MNGTTFEEMREALEKSQKMYGEQRERTKEARDRAARHEVTINDLRAELAALREPESVVSPDREIINRAIARIQENCEGGAPVRTSLSILDDLLEILSSPTSVGGEA